MGMQLLVLAAVLAIFTAELAWLARQCPAQRILEICTSIRWQRRPGPRRSRRSARTAPVPALA